MLQFVVKIFMAEIEPREIYYQFFVKLFREEQKNCKRGILPSHRSDFHIVQLVNALFLAWFIYSEVFVPTRTFFHFKVWLTMGVGH